MIFDEATGELALVANHLAIPYYTEHSRKTYRVLVVRRDGSADAVATFLPQSDGREHGRTNDALVFVPADATRREIATFAVTLEDASAPTVKFSPERAVLVENKNH